MIEIVQHSTHGGPTGIKETKAQCTPNDYQWHGVGERKLVKIADDAKAEVANGGGGVTKSVSVGELETHADDCKTNPDNVKEPYSCSGNIYDVTMDAEGNINSIKEIWRP